MQFKFLIIYSTSSDGQILYGSLETYNISLSEKAKH